MVVIPMRFNEHQIEDAKNLAKELGIIFSIKKSYRWDDINDPMLPKDLSLIATVARKRFEHN